MAYYECGSKEYPESIIITLVPDRNQQDSPLHLGHLSTIYLYIDNTFIERYINNGNFFWSNKTYTYASPKSNKSVTINIIPNIINVQNLGCPTSVQLGINGIVVQTLVSGDSYFICGAIVYKYTFS